MVSSDKFYSFYGAAILSAFAHNSVTVIVKLLVVDLRLFRGERGAVSGAPPSYGNLFFSMLIFPIYPSIVFCELISFMKYEKANEKQNVGKTRMTGAGGQLTCQAETYIFEPRTDALPRAATGKVRVCKRLFGEQVDDRAGNTTTLCCRDKCPKPTAALTPHRDVSQ